MVQDSTGRRFAYPANYFDFPGWDSISFAVSVLRRVGWSLVRYQGSRAILRRGRDYRYICGI